MAGDGDPRTYDPMNPLVRQLFEAGRTIRDERLWELYKIALPLFREAGAAMDSAKYFLAHWKAETETPEPRSFEEQLTGSPTNFPGGQEPGGED